MAKRHDTHACATCGTLSTRLFQSFTSGEWECGSCALKDPSPFMSAAIVASIRRRISEATTSARRAELARKNFGHETQATA